MTRHAVPGSGIMAACGGSARFEHREFVRSGRQPAGRSDHQIGRHGPGSLATTGCTAGARRTARTSLRSCSTGAATSRERASSASSLSESHRGCLAPRFAVEVQQLRFLQPNTSVVVEGRATSDVHRGGVNRAVRARVPRWRAKPPFPRDPRRTDTRQFVRTLRWSRASSVPEASRTARGRINHSWSLARNGGCSTRRRSLMACSCACRREPTSRCSSRATSERAES